MRLEYKRPRTIKVPKRTADGKHVTPVGVISGSTQDFLDIVSMMPCVYADIKQLKLDAKKVHSEIELNGLKINSDNVHKCFESLKESR